MPRMSKAERARQAAEAAAERARIAQALRWTTPTAPDVPPPTGAGLSEGWTYILSQARVAIACSSATAQGIGRSDRTTWRGAIWLYSSRLRALQALRHAVELRVAKELAEIDRAIEDEQAQ